MKTTFLLLAALLMLRAPANAAASLPAATEAPFRLYSVAEGLNQRTVLAVAQDEDGFLWVATFGGLNRFDGRSFESYTTRQGLRQNLVQALAVDDRNRLWAGDAAGGLTLIENGQVTRTIEPVENSRGVVRAIVQVEDRLYVGTQPGGLRVLPLDALDDGLTVVADSPDEVLGLVVSRAGEIYALGSQGLYSYRPGRVRAFEMVAEGVSSVQADDSGNIAVGDRSGRIGWLGDDGIEWLDITYDGEVSSLVIDDGRISWVFLEGQGMLPFGDPHADVVLPFGGTAAAMRDSEGVLWVPARAGLARYLGARFEHYPLELDDLNPEVFSILPGDEGDFWFGTNGGLLHLSSDGTLTNVSDQLDIERREVRDIRYSLDRETLWIGHVAAPIHGIDLPSMKIKKSMGDENALTVSLELDAKDRLWSGSYRGTLSVYDPSTDSSQSYQISEGAAIYSIDLADDGYLWFGANYSGIYRIDTNEPDAQPEQVVSVDTLGHEFFTHVVVEGAGADTTVWFTSIQGGVFRLRNGTATQVIPESALSDYTVYSIQPLPDGSLVLATSRGAYRYDLSSRALEQYTALDGFVAIEAKVHATYFDGDHSLIIGTTGGVTVMDVSLPMAGVGTPTPLITRRTIDERAVDAVRVMPGGARVGTVLIEFTAVSTRKPFGLEYSYRLTGQDADWSAPSDTTSIGYSNLNPGEYRFEVRARLPGGTWSEPASWSFSVPTPFWRTSWFAALVALAAIGLTWSIIQLRLRSVARINKRLRNEVAERTESIEAGRRELELANAQLSSEIQERKRADALRAEVEARFHQAYQNSPIGMALVNTDGLVYDTNPKMKNLFWPDSANSDREPLNHVICEGDREWFSRFLDAYAAGSSAATSMEVDCIAASGDIRRIDFHPSAVRDHEGELKYIVLLAHDVTESRAMTDQLEYQATFDELTGLLNRRAFSARLAEVGASSKEGETAFLMFLDLDQFKVVNDTCGHAAGDELLCTVSRLIRGCVRDHDTVARLGGDEFGLIISGCSQEVALQRAESVRQHIQDLEFLWGQDVFRIGVSIGVVPVTEATQDLNELQQVADAACYAAKEAGRNRVHLVSGTEDAAHEHRGEMRWVQRLNHAIDTDSLVLFGQRIKPLGGVQDEAERIEILLRMRDRDSNRLIPPGAFLPAAERYGLHGRLDQWVVGRVIDVLASWDRDEVAQKQFWINLSGASVGDAKIASELVRRVEAADLPAGCLNFEITETAVIRKIDDAAKLIHSLQEMGCRFSLDDFGSGLSSFGYLKRLNVNSLKIDGQFVRDILTDPTDRIFVKSIIDIAHTLGMRVVAEFVENDEILKMVESLGSDYAQGFGVHRPEPLDVLVGVAGALQGAADDNHDVVSAGERVS